MVNIPDFLSPEHAALIYKLPQKDQRELLDLLSLYNEANRKERANRSFIPFMQYVWEDAIVSAHHQYMGDIFDAIIRGEKTRVIINIAPRVGKSMLTSKYLPAFMLGKNPKMKIIQATHTTDFARKWGAEVRDLIAENVYKEVFAGVTLKADQKAAGFWRTTQGGEYYAMGVEKVAMGRGADLLIIDDPFTEEDLKLAPYKPKILDRVFDWYQSIRGRVHPDGAILIVHSRVHARDLTGRLLERASKDPKNDQWELIEFPAIFPDGKVLFPEQRPREYWESMRRETTRHTWNAQYLQNPVSEEGAMVKREWWRAWDKKSRPDFEYVIQSWDTAYTAKTTSDFCACTTWGVFQEEDPETGRRQNKLMLMDSFNKRLEFPELKVEAKRLHDELKPDFLLIEAKAAGAPLLYELRSMGIPAMDYTPTRGNDKIVRMTAVTDMFKSGPVYFLPTEENFETIEQFAAFPNGSHDDLVDSGVQALMRIRQGGLVRTMNDYEDEDEEEDQFFRMGTRYY